MRVCIDILCRLLCMYVVGISCLCMPRFFNGPVPVLRNQPGPKSQLPQAWQILGFGMEDLQVGRKIVEWSFHPITKNICRPCSAGRISPNAGRFYCFWCPWLLIKCIWLMGRGRRFYSISPKAPQLGDDMASFFKDRLGSCFNQGFGIIWDIALKLATHRYG